MSGQDGSEDFFGPDDEPVCGACGQRHPAVRGACDLDPMNEATQIGASVEEVRLKEALWAVNRAVLKPEVASRSQVTLERIRDEIWELGQELYGWTD